MSSEQQTFYFNTHAGIPVSCKLSDCLRKPLEYEATHNRRSCIFANGNRSQFKYDDGSIEMDNFFKQGVCRSGGGVSLIPFEERKVEITDDITVLIKNVNPLLKSGCVYVFEQLEDDTTINHYESGIRRLHTFVDRVKEFMGDEFKDKRTVRVKNIKIYFDGMNNQRIFDLYREYYTLLDGAYIELCFKGNPRFMDLEMLDLLGFKFSLDLGDARLIVNKAPKNLLNLSINRPDFVSDLPLLLENISKLTISDSGLIFLCNEYIKEGKTFSLRKLAVKSTGFRVSIGRVLQLFPDLTYITPSTSVAFDEPTPNLTVECLENQFHVMHEIKRLVFNGSATGLMKQLCPMYSSKFVGELVYKDLGNFVVNPFNTSALNGVELRVNLRPDKAKSARSNRLNVE